LPPSCTAHRASVCPGAPGSRPPARSRVTPRASSPRGPQRFRPCQRSLPSNSRRATPPASPCATPAAPAEPRAAPQPASAASEAAARGGRQGLRQAPRRTAGLAPCRLCRGARGALSAPLPAGAPPGGGQRDAAARRHLPAGGTPSARHRATFRGEQTLRRAREWRRGRLCSDRKRNITRRASPGRRCRWRRGRTSCACAPALPSPPWPCHHRLPSPPSPPCLCAVFVRRLCVRRCPSLSSFGALTVPRRCACARRAARSWRAACAPPRPRWSSSLRCVPALGLHLKPRARGGIEHEASGERA